MASYGDFEVTVNKFDIEDLISRQQTMQRIVAQANSAISEDIEHPWIAIGQLQWCADYAAEILYRYREIIGEAEARDNG